MKTKITTFLFALSTTFTLSAQVDLKDGLLVHLPFSGNARDTSGNDRHGSVFNAELTADRFGNPNSAYSFNGDNAYIQLPTNGLTNNNYTYSLWVNADEIPASGKYTYPFSIGGTGGGQNVALCNNSMTGWAGGAYNDGTPSTSLVAVGVQPEIGTWYHVVLMRTNTKIKLYINGVLNTNEPDYNGADATTGGTNPLYGTQVLALIGARNLLADFFYKGLIDDIRVYDRVLNDDEIEALFNENKETSIITSEANSESINCYPNPSEGHFTIDLKNSSYESYHIYNSLGQEVLNSGIDQFSTTIDLNLSDFPEGIYTVLLTGNIRQSLKLIIKR